MISITMTPETFSCVLEKLETMDGVTLSDVDKEKGTGHIHTKYVDADFEYREEGRSVVFLNEKKHGLYGFVSDDTIGTHLNDMLSKFNCPEEIPETESLPAVNNSGTEAVSIVDGATGTEVPTTSSSSAFVTPASESEAK